MPTSMEISLEPGELLYREGDANDCGYIIESGEVLLYHEATGRRINCERRGAGSILGELSILTGRPRAVSVEALTPCRAFKISAEQVLDRFDKLDPVLRACVDTSISFSATYAERLRNQSEASDHPETSTEVPLVPSTLRNAAELIEKLRLEAEILKALEGDDFYLVYQPIVRLQDRIIVGVESLMRWHHPTLGAIRPDQFIPIAEEMNSIGKLTEHALTTAVKILRDMRSDGIVGESFYVTVNVSGKDIVRDGFVEFVAFLLDRYDLQPDVLKLELTETALLSDHELARKNLERLRGLGCGISVDDFGTGYSNFAYLKDLPLTTLKIDRAFVSEIHSSSVSRSIVSMLIQLGNELDVETIAEGLETKSEIDLLRELGCRFAQGFHLYKPMREADLIQEISGYEEKTNRVA